MNAKSINVVKSIDRFNPLWSNDKATTKCIVDAMLKFCYEKFKVQGYLFLNEVYRELRIPPTAQGQVAGWDRDMMNGDDVMWTVWTKQDDCNVCITFEPLDNILDALPDE